MRIGVVGCGYWGSKHVRVLHTTDGVSDVVVIDGDSDRRASLAKAFPSVGTRPSLEDAIDEVDAVIVATPPRTHHRLARLALEHGRHVLVEKPLATSNAEARDLVRVADAGDLVLKVGHTFEHNAAVWRLRQAVAGGELGDIHYIDSARLNLGLYQSDVNVIWDLAPHDISIANYVLDARPQAVTAWASSHANAHADVATIRLDYEAIDVTATIRVSWLDPCKVRRTTIVGSQRMAVYDDLDDNERVRVYDRGVDRRLGGTSHELPMSYRYGDVVAPYVDLKEPLLVEDQDFVDAIRSSDSGRAGGRSGLDVVEAVVAAQESVARGRTVTIDDLVPAVAS
ncbi:MAG: Gfo/Idh/MocA family oxidoreductase [Actinomycetota bacterium]|nr:Gfo/Idh/MocA family oxidoreductase [Actinomycetota bacterium]